MSPSAVESLDYAAATPPPLCTLALGESGEGAYTQDRSLHFRVTTITDRRMPRERVIFALSLMFDGQNSRKSTK